MAAWQRCAKCNYIRHVNDDGRSRRDTCPKCGAIYSKAELASQRAERRRWYRAHRRLLDRTCGRCNEIVSSFARFCPHCQAPVRGHRRTRAYAAAAAMFAVALVVGLIQDAKVISPFPGISDGHFEQCVALSRDWSNALSKHGSAAIVTLQAQNDWHASCSLKSLRTVARRSPTRLPRTPEGWIVAMHD